jgi:hypothetical protein
MTAPAPVPRSPQAPAGGAGMAPASSAEQMLWLTEQLQRGSLSTVALAHLRLDGPVRRPQLQAALEAVRRRHPALRTAFVAHGGRLWRRTLAAPAALALQPLPPATGRREAVRALCSERYDLAAGDVLRVGLADRPDGADLYLAAHHVAFDGHSEVAVAADLAEAYGQALAGRAPSLAERPRLAARELATERRAVLVAYWFATGSWSSRSPSRPKPFACCGSVPAPRPCRSSRCC